MSGDASSREVDVAIPPRRRRRWAAFLLNLFLAPSGYVYAGYPRLAALLVGGVLILGAAVEVWTFSSPPGVYAGMSLFAGAGSRPSLLWLLPGWLLNLAVAFHAVRLCGRPLHSDASGVRLWLKMLGYLCVLPAAGLLSREYLPLATYTISSSVMEPTLSRSDIIWADGARALCNGGTVRPGDVVVLRRAGVNYASRAIAGGGHTIEIAGGVPIIDGVPARQRAVGTRQPDAEEFSPMEMELEETLPNNATYRIAMFSERQPQDTVAPTRLPPHTWFVLGDNRDDSRDSRFVGPVAEKDICGVAIKVLLSKDRARIGRRP